MLGLLNMQAQLIRSLSKCQKYAHSHSQSSSCLAGVYALTSSAACLDRFTTDQWTHHHLNLSVLFIVTSAITLIPCHTSLSGTLKISMTAFQSRVPVHCFSTVPFRAPMLQRKNCPGRESNPRPAEADVHCSRTNTDLEGGECSRVLCEWPGLLLSLPGGLALWRSW